MGFAEIARKTLREIKREEDSIVKESPIPYFGPDGDITIPFNSDRRYHWWIGGQSVKDTIEELKGAFHA
ncbi:MAG: hypothetical protein K8I01_12630 [Candidatus Methylomirabilis sp.]|nr:hypothetical protein [Deltaproteobacteria bacterium]